MSGNVWEWCADWYDQKAYDRYKWGDLTSPQDGTTRVLRGGSWYFNYLDYFRCADRYSNYPDYRFNYYGFRCARTL